MDEKEAFENLAFAVIAQAVDDYRHALRVRDKWEIKSLERFFHGGWFVTLSGGADPDFILEKVLAVKSSNNYEPIGRKRERHKVIKGIRK